MKSDLDIIHRNIEIQRKFEREEEIIPNVMSRYQCQNCGHISENLDIKKHIVEDQLKYIENLEKIMNDHNRELGRFGKKWEMIFQHGLIVAREKGSYIGWVNNYSVSIPRIRHCHVKCPVCKNKFPFKYG